MKKILIALLAMMVVFGFVACDDGNDGPDYAEVVKAGDFDTTPIKADTTAETFQKDVKISADGVISGTFNYVTEVGMYGENEDEGYYALLSFDLPENGWLKIAVDPANEGDDNAEVQGDGDKIIYLGNTPELAAAKTIKAWISADQKYTEEPTITLTFGDNAVFPEKAAEGPQA